MAKKRGPKPRDGEREPSGRLSRNPGATREKRENAQRTAMEARMRLAGILPPPVSRLPGESDDSLLKRREIREAMIRANTPYVSQPWMGCNAGRIIAGEPDVVALWQTVTLYRQRRKALLEALSAPPDDAAGMALMVAPAGDALLDAPPPDLRAEDEIAAAGRRAWEELVSILAEVGPTAPRYVFAIVIGDAAIAFPDPLPRMLRYLRLRLDGATVEEARAGAKSP